MDRLFGTDGIRGEVGKYPLTKAGVFAIGRTLGLWLKQQHQPKDDLRILVGKDTRQSGDELELALLEGAKYEGLKALRLGVCPTPCVAFLTFALGAQLGIAISASHNPGSDNGIKFFDLRGYKLFPAAEDEIEKVFLTLANDKVDFEFSWKDFKPEIDWFSLYLDFIRNSVQGLKLSGLKIVADCAFGSFSKVAPRVLRELGAEVRVINDEPDGKNINVNCGTLFPQAMAEKIIQHNADLGIAFDGDGDRVIVADEKANILDGDRILAILSEYLLAQNSLPKNAIICTQMSNIGLEIWLKQRGIRMIRTSVGDKYVLQEMLRQGINLGGEQSGHIIIIGRSTTGDGLIAALELIKAMIKTKKPLSSLAGDLKRFPQILLNIKVKEKKPFGEICGLNAAINRWQKKLGKTGRMLIRYSGTENLARVMVEGQKISLVNQAADFVGKIIQQSIGV